MSTACDELARLCERENARKEQYGFDGVIRYSETYREAYSAAKRLIAEAETFTQGSEAKRLAIADAISHQHRSHQQGFVRGVVIPALAALEFNGRRNMLDARNQAATDFAVHALDAADEHNSMWMPFI